MLQSILRTATGRSVCSSTSSRFRFGLHWLTILTVLLGVACGEGDRGPAGAQGDPGIPGRTGEPESLTAEIESASLSHNGELSVDFYVQDEGGYGFDSLQASQVRFTVAKLIPAGFAGAGERSAWQSYINRTEAAPTDPANGPGTETAIQATYESSGTLGNLANGRYRYVFSTNLKSVTSPLAVSYTASQTHRVALQISGRGVPVANATYDWLPSSGVSAGVTSKIMVSRDTCNACHGDLAIHGGGRKDPNYCVTCHNTGSVDANSGNTLDFAVMLHKIHFGSDLPSVQSGNEYAIWGFRNNKHDYSDVHYPQDVRNCRSCHDESDAATPEAGNWLLYPTADVCGSCHDDVNFATGENHVAGARDNSECSTCHVGGINNQLSVDFVHEIGGYSDAKNRLTLRVDDSFLHASDNDVQLQFTFVNPSDGSVYTQPVSVMNFVNRARLYRNPVDLQTGYIDAFNYYDLTTLTPNAEGQYTLDTDIVLASGEILAFSTRIRVCTNPNTGDLLDCADPDAENAGVTPMWGNVDATGTLLSGANELTIGADYERCESCHADPTINVHGGDYSSLQQCRACHNNSFLRDIGNLDLKFIIHAYHAGNLNDGAGSKESVHYPDNVGNCAQCHTDEQLDLPLSANVWAPETASGVYSSGVAFVCASCHLSTQPGEIDPANLSALPASDQALVGHMIQNGAIFNGTQSAANVTESCSVCHAKGSLAAIDSVHGNL